MAGAAPGAAAGAARLATPATPATPAAGRVVQGERARGAAKMLQVLVLQVEDPDCFWVIIKGCSPFLDHEVDYQKLNSAMNDFYNSMCKDTEIKPLMLEEGQHPSCSGIIYAASLQSKKFRLYCMKPVTLHIDFCEDSAEIVLWC
nr:putative ATP-dependent RNA helicase TDRD12 [Oryctolagus cuniculus]